ncbi:hypothetical protein [uncultured Sanguibacteroides sp.]|uniref:hypothetical protein n=1 Tax=uncultured Sanguibacteroides sp. TaxID=1635151 RepID=UPI0025EE1003|nr:hypothetical protein [uncultured Sanguibacteroides sp.]
MEKKNEKKEEAKNLAVVKVENQKAETPKKEFTTEEIKKIIAENEALKKKASNEPQNFEEKIEYFLDKKEKIYQLSKLDTTHLKLTEHLDEIQGLTTEDEFTCREYILSVAKPNAYRNDEDVFKMNNPVIIGDVIKFVLSRIEEKQETLKAAIAL